MEKEMPNYYSILPASVRYDKKLTLLEKILYSEVTSLSNKDGCCWASNNYFSELYNKGEKWISRALNNLAKKGYITIEVEKNFLRKIYITPKGETEIIKKKEKKKKEPMLDIYYKLSELLFDKIKENHNNLIIQYNKDKWADIFRKIVEIDNYKTEIIKQVILFSQSDKFWKKNILSANKFREKFNTLLAQMPDEFQKEKQEEKLYYNDKEVFFEIERQKTKDTVAIIKKYYFYEKDGSKVYLEGRYFKDLKNKII